MATSNTIISGAAAQNWNVTWEIQGALTVPAGNTYSDGYNLKFTGTVVTNMTAANHKNVCVQYLDSAGAAMALTDTAAGAPHICMQALSAAAVSNQTSIAVKTMTHAQLGCNAAASPACTALQNAGTALPAGAVATWDSDGAGTATGALAATKARHVTWWQPTESSDYASALRRYSKGDKVKGHNLALQAGASVASTVVTFAMFTSGAVVTLAGASTLAAGVALGAAALAF